MQVLLAAINAVNGVISGLFASNCVGDAALSALALFSPVNFLIVAVGAIFLGGAQILCGEYLGRNRIEEMKEVFSLDISAVTVVGLLLTAGLLICGIFDLGPAAGASGEVRAAFNLYLIGQAVGVLPFLLGQQLFAFLSLELRNRRTTLASVVFIVVNILFNFLLVYRLQMGALGLALAAAAGSWVFLIVLGQYYFTEEAVMKFALTRTGLRHLPEMLRIGLPNSLLQGYQMLRGIIVNALILRYVGDAGLAAFAASGSALGIVWAVPLGMQAVCRMLFSVSQGEEDRQSLADIMRTVLLLCVPLMLVIVVIVILLADPLTHLFYRDPSALAYQLTADAFRILPLCMPLSIVTLAFVCYGQASGKHTVVHVDTAFDGVIGVAGFTAILIGSFGMHGFYWANVLNGVGTILIFVIYAIIKKRGFPRSMEELLAIPEGFGAAAKDRIDIAIRGMEEVLNTSRKVMDFCREHGVDRRHSYFASLCLEEMAGNVVEHGFTKDHKRHSVDVRVVYKKGTLILRIKDDCIPFDPGERRKVMNPDDPMKNMGIRMVYDIADEISYQQMLGLNVLIIKLGREGEL